MSFREPFFADIQVLAPLCAPGAPKPPLRDDGRHFRPDKVPGGAGASRFPYLGLCALATRGG